jgi:hypothetical protein
MRDSRRVFKRGAGGEGLEKGELAEGLGIRYTQLSQIVEKPAPMSADIAIILESISRSRQAETCTISFQQVFIAPLWQKEGL